MLDVFSPDKLARVVKELNLSTYEKVEARKHSLTRSAFLESAAAVGAAAAGAFCSSWLFWLGYLGAAAALALACGMLAGRSVLRHRRFNAYATLLAPLTSDEYDQLSNLAEQSNVVQVAMKAMSKRHRLAYRADLLYARALVVREARFGSKDTDRLPLEQTKGMLAPI